MGCPSQRILPSDISKALLLQAWIYMSNIQNKTTPNQQSNFLILYDELLIASQNLGGRIVI